MNTDIAYKGLKYIVVWILLYFLIKYTSNNEMTDIDIALVVTVLTLLLCIVETMLVSTPSKGIDMNVGTSTQNKTQYQYTRPNTSPHIHSNEYMNSSSDVSISGKQNASVTNNSDMASISSDVSSIISSDLSSDLSSSSSNSSSNSSAGSSSDEIKITIDRNLPGDVKNDNLPPKTDDVSPDLSPDNLHNYTRTNSPSTNSPTIGKPLIPDLPNPSSQPVTYDNHTYQNFTLTDPTSTDPYQTVKDYMAKKVVFDSNGFGGTSIKDSGKYSGEFGKASMFGLFDAEDSDNNSTESSNSSNSSDSDDEINININVPTPRVTASMNGSGKTFVRPDDAIASSTAPTVTSTTFSGKNSIQSVPNKNNGTNGSNSSIKWYEQVFDPRSYAGAENLDQIDVTGGRTRNDMLVNQMVYSDFNRLPPSFVDKDFEYGYSFLPPKDWYPVPPYPPVCVSNTTCSPKPVYLDSTTMDLKEWHETQKITPPDSINTKFITDELNSKV